MNRDLLYFTLSLGALYLVFDQFVGKKRISALTAKLWGGSDETEEETEDKKSISDFADDAITTVKATASGALDRLKSLGSQEVTTGGTTNGGGAGRATV